jgi:hypothetical protein
LEHAQKRRHVHLKGTGRVVLQLLARPPAKSAKWIEILVEKNTVASAIEGVAAKYTIPMTSGRGYCPREKKWWKDSGRAGGRNSFSSPWLTSIRKDRTFPTPNSFGVSLRDDLHIEEEKLVIVRAALTHSQIQTLDLHEGQLAKEDSSRYQRFVQKYGKRCWELEAVPTDTLRKIVEDCIRRHLDLDAFKRELEIQKADHQEINEEKQRIKKLITGY